jgi:hypothetical protein
VSQNEYDAAIAEFIRTKGTTRCPTACTYPTDGTVSATDRAALEAYAVERERSRRRKITAHAQPFWTFGVTRSANG